MDNPWKNLGNFLVELLFPSFCLGCRREGTIVCQDCIATLDISEYHYCLCNQKPLRMPGGGKCNRCRDRKLSGLYFALAYQEKALTRKLIHNFKYKPYIKSLAKPLAGILVQHFLHSQTPTTAWQNSVLVAVPVEKSKLKSRGYNQAQLLAKELGHFLHVPSIANVLVKIKKTAPQMKLGAKERQENLRGAFALKNPAFLAGKNVLLVDDVYTTGSTMEECASILKNAGVKQVWGIAIAREG